MVQMTAALSTSLGPHISPDRQVRIRDWSGAAPKPSSPYSLDRRHAGGGGSSSSSTTSPEGRYGLVDEDGYMLEIV